MPLMAIVNLYINMAARGELAAKIGDHCPMESICGIDTLDQVLETQLGVGGMLAAATPMLALMIVTGSTFAFTSIASRLNGADHIDEKMVAPDGMKVAPAYEVTSQTTRDPANGEHKTGAESMIPTITYEYGTKTTVSSKRSTTQADQDNYAKSLGQVDQQITQGGKTEIFNEAQQRNLSSILSKSDSAAIQQRRDWAETHNAMGLLSTSLGATAGLSVEKALAMMKDSPFEAAFRADMKAQAQKGISTAKAIGLNASDITSMQAAHANSVASTIQQGNNIDFSIKDGQTIASNLQQVASRLESDSRSFDQMAGEEGGVKMQSTANVAQVAEAVMGLEDKTNRTDEENAILANVHGAMSYGNQNYGREIEQKAAAYQRSFGMTARAARIAATAGVLYDHREKDQVNAVCSPLSPISTSTGSTVTDSRQYSGNYAPNNAGVKEEVKNETDDIDQLTGRGKENAQYWADYIIGAKYGFNTMKLPGEEEVDKHHKAAQQEVSVVIDQNNAAVDAKGEPTIETAFDHVFSALGVKEYAPYIARAFGATETGLTVKVPEVPSTPSSSGKNFIPEKQGTKQK
jgi:conjugal transfer mating pair stabilization protein TraG